MRIMITASLLLNVAVLLPVCFGILTNAPWAQEAYGGPTPARDILLAVYAVIGGASVALLFIGEPRWVASLLILQVAYKLLTLFTVGSWQHPVVTANLLIAVFHAATLVVLWRGDALVP
ncbi:MAG: hypothetical protein AAGD06_25610 [Acidobacteriota bacterium]